MTSAGAPTNYEALNARLLAGDARAFEEIVEQILPWMRRAAQQYIKDRDVAASIVSDAILDVWERRARLRSMVQMRSQLTLMVAFAVDEYRRTRGTSVRAVSLDARVPRSPNGDEPLPTIRVRDLLIAPEADTETFDPETFTQLLEAVAQLGEPHRSIVTLRAQGANSWSDIARITGIGIRDVYQLYARAVTSLRGRFNVEPG